MIATLFPTWLEAAQTWTWIGIVLLVALGLYGWYRVLDALEDKQQAAWDRQEEARVSKLTVKRDFHESILRATQEARRQHDAELQRRRELNAAVRAVDRR